MPINGENINIEILIYEMYELNIQTGFNYQYTFFTEKFKWG